MPKYLLRETEIRRIWHQEFSVFSPLKVSKANCIRPLKYSVEGNNWFYLAVSPFYLQELFPHKSYTQTKQRIILIIKSQAIYPFSLYWFNKSLMELFELIKQKRLITWTSTGNLLPSQNVWRAGINSLNVLLAFSTPLAYFLNEIVDTDSLIHSQTEDVHMKMCGPSLPEWESRPRG